MDAFTAHPAWCGEIDRGAVVPFMGYGHVRSPYTMHRRIRKYFPAHIHHWFGVAENNEAENAKAVTEHLGTEHRELCVTAPDAMATIPRLFGCVR